MEVAATGLVTVAVGFGVLVEIAVGDKPTVSVEGIGVGVEVFAVAVGEATAPLFTAGVGDSSPAQATSEIFRIKRTRPEINLTIKNLSTILSSYSKASSIARIVPEAEAERIFVFRTVVPLSF